MEKELLTVIINDKNMDLKEINDNIKTSATTLIVLNDKYINKEAYTNGDLRLEYNGDNLSCKEMVYIINEIIKDYSNAKNDIIFYITLNDIEKNEFYALAKEHMEYWIGLENIGIYFREKIQREWEDFNKIPAQVFLNVEKKLNNMIKDAHILSPFEKFLYAYLVTANLKEYKKDNNEYGATSRNLYYIMADEKMPIVCAGFAILLVDLCTKLGIKTSYISMPVNVGFRGEDFAKKEYHARVQVFIDDPKYDIKGMYISDPTFDNMEYRINHALLTKFEYNYLESETFIDNEEEYLIYAGNEKEFIEMLNAISLRLFNKQKGRLSDYYEQDHSELFIIKYHLVSNFINNIRQLDEYIYELTKTIIEKIEEANNEDIYINLVCELIDKVSKYVEEVNNKTIKKTDYIDALLRVFEAQGLPYADCIEKVCEVIDNSADTFDDSFINRETSYNTFFNKFK